MLPTILLHQKERLDKPLKVIGTDEVGRLASSVELMRRNLNRKIQTISFQGRLAHDFNAVLDLDETIEELQVDGLGGYVMIIFGTEANADTVFPWSPWNNN